MPITPIQPNDPWSGTSQRSTPPPLGIPPLPTQFTPFADSDPQGTPQPGNPPKRNGIFGPLTAALVIGFKYFKLLLSSGKFLLLGKTFLSMAISIGFYAMGRGWAFGAMFVALLFAHEMGHVWAARRIGLPVSAPMFIPFLGALITMKRNPQSVAHEAYVAVGGPILGTIGCMVALTFAWATQSAFLFHMAAIGFGLNLFNLVPVSPLDGGRIIASVSPWLWLVGAVVMGALLVWMNAWIFLLIMAYMVGPQINKLFKGRDWEWKVYHTCTARQRIYASGAWGAMVVLLGALLGISSIGVGAPGHPLAGLTLLVAWPVCALVGAVCFFTWPLEEPVLRRIPQGAWE